MNIMFYDDNASGGSGDGETTPPTTTSAAPPATPPAKPPARSNVDVSAYQAKIDALEAKTASLISERDGLKDQFTKATDMLTEMQNKVKAGDDALAAFNTKLAELTQFKEEAEPTLQLYKMVASDPAYHPLIGSVDAIKVMKTPEEQKKILDTLAGDRTRYGETLVGQFKAGGAPAMPGATPTQQPPAGPKDSLEALKAAYNSAGISPDEFERAMNQFEAFGKAGPEA